MLSLKAAHYLALGAPHLTPDAALLLPLRSSAIGFVTTQAYSLGAKGGCGGKAAKLPAPPTASQRITFMGRGGPEALRCHMSPKGV